MRAPSHETTHGQLGLSLIDTLVALMILSFALVSVSLLTSTTIESNRDSRRLSAATRLAQSKVEELRALDYASVVPGADAALTATGASGSGGSGGAHFTRAWTVTADTPVSAAKSVAVRVGWSDKGDAREVVLHTLVTDR